MRELWIDHEAQYHRHQWVCDWPHDDKPNISAFHSADEFQEHLVKDHKDLFNEKYLQLLVGRGKQELDMPFLECPFCHDTFMDMKKSEVDASGVDLLAERLLKHVGYHISNFSFYAFLDSNETEDSMRDQMTAPKSVN